ncbi:uncharacterized protein LOC121380111 [Gigantopelta aegis]|uniref:uncharacterized protein LOC121380111 n=1 Tax=Gigantopelta aegis TaxID=1735272 RepID=UPI001B889EDB|nr:uncharacterized protein LOC121380111 [Gigantopelta aegis]
MEPNEVTVVVHGARGLKGKKHGRCKFSVIFGVGIKKYRTSIVKESSGNPDWNEESVVKVDNSGDYAFFTVTEKEDILGQIVIPLTSLPTVQGQVKRTPLRPHKKCPVPRGELIYQCYVSSKRPISEAQQSPSNSLHQNGPHLTGFARLRQNLMSSTLTLQQTQRKERKTSTLSNLNKKFSKSFHDIFSFGKAAENESKSSFRSFSINANMDDTGEAPIINCITPNVVGIEGGTRLVIDGKNLGLGKSDIVELILCGCDLLDSVEFESSSRIYCTTKATTSAGKGDLWLETISGGQIVLKNVFTLVDKSAPVNILGKGDKEGEDDVSIESGGISFTANSDESQTPSPHPKRMGTNHSICSESENQDSKYTTNSLPRPKNSGEIQGKFVKKNFIKHIRQSSESVLTVKHESKEQENMTVAELKAEITKLQNENKGLKKDFSALQAQNRDMKGYIDRLLTKVLVHCPEALENDPPRF